MSDYLEVLSDFVAETCYEDLEPETIAAINDITLDTIGAIIAGSQLPENGELARLIAGRSGPATSTIIGHNLKVEPMLATLINATAGVALEMDEGNRFGGGHPAIHVLPGALAVAEELGIGGKRLIESILVGYEITSRIGGAMKLRDNVHSHGLWGTIGTAVAVAKLRGWKSRQVREVINLAASMSPANTWTPCYEGATIRNLYPGRSGLQGILATHLLDCGFTGLRDGPADVFGSILAEDFDSDATVEGLGADFRVEQNYFKFYACCRFNHAALEAVFSLMHQNSLPADQVEGVEVVTGYTPGMVGEYPTNTLAAKFSVPYSVAAALVRGIANVTAFYPESVADADIEAMAQKVHVQYDPDMFMRRDNATTATVTVSLTDGRTLSEKTHVVQGDAANPVSHQELVEKYHFLSDRTLGRDKADAIVSTINRLDQLADVRELTSLLGG